MKISNKFNESNSLVAQLLFLVILTKNSESNLICYKNFAPLRINC